MCCEALFSVPENGPQKQEAAVSTNCTSRELEELRNPGMAKRKQRLGLFVRIEGKKNIVSFS
jgi:DNA-binding transcriptional regulator YhcF (GntR family)